MLNSLIALFHPIQLSYQSIMCMALRYVTYMEKCNIRDLLLWMRQYLYLIKNCLINVAKA